MTTHRWVLSDGETFIVRAHGEAPARVRIGSSDCRGAVLPARG